MISLSSAAVNPVRSMLLAAAGALVGLSIAGMSLFSARGTTTHTVPPESIALVNQRPILRSDFITQLESETGDSFAHSNRAQQLKILDEMIREELLVQRGLELDFGETDQSVRNALATAMSQQALSDAVTSMPTEEQLHRYYDKHHALYLSEGILVLREWRLARVPGEADPALLTRAAAAAARLQGGQRGGTPGVGAIELATVGEQFYFAVRAQLGDRLFKEITTLANGDFAKPVLDQDGAKIVQIVRNTVPAPLPFERTETEVLNDYKKEQQDKLMEATMKFLRERSSLLIAPDYARDYHP